MNKNPLGGGPSEGAKKAVGMGGPLHLSKLCTRQKQHRFLRTSAIAIHGFQCEKAVK
jgi:hypothetical protein